MASEEYLRKLCIARAHMHPGGGCHGKLEGELLTRLLTTAWAESPGDTPAFVSQPEDSALIEISQGPLLFSTDLAPLLGVNLFDAGRIAVLHALNDIYASGGRPRWALVTLLLDRNSPIEHGEALMRGVIDMSRQEEVSILGGHTVRAAEAMVGLSVIGTALGVPLRKTGAQPGHRILLSKPVGTGLCLAGFKHGLCGDDVLAEAAAVMLASNKYPASRAVQANASSCTDVSGFGLLGHLSELLLHPGMGAELISGAVPCLAFAANAPRSIADSPWIRNNYEYALSRIDVRSAKAVRELAVFLDPQTSGPLLLTAEDSFALQLHSAGFKDIGRVTDQAAIVVQ